MAGVATATAGAVEVAEIGEVAVEVEAALVMASTTTTSSST